MFIVMVFHRYEEIVISVTLRKGTSSKDKRHTQISANEIMWRLMQHGYQRQTQTNQSLARPSLKAHTKQKSDVCVIYLQPPVVTRLMAALGRSCEGIIIPRWSVKVDASLIHKVNHVLTKSFLLEHGCAAFHFLTASSLKNGNVFRLNKVRLRIFCFELQSDSLKGNDDVIVTQGNSLHVF